MHSTIHADQLGKEPIKESKSKNSCRPFYYPRLGKTYQRQAEDEWLLKQKVLMFSSCVHQYWSINGTLSKDLEFATCALGHHEISFIPNSLSRV